jgi:aminoethylphosphonate catabolism LysR family transcriptional regulator
MLYTQLRAFHGVAAHGGFTAASKVMNVGQPTLTSHVKALEQAFDVELFHPRGRRVVMTDAGIALFQLTRRIMDIEGEARDLLHAFGGFNVGELHVGAVGPFHATEMLSLFSEKFPDIKLSVALGNSREMVDLLLDYSVDVAVLAHVEDDPRIYALPFSRHPVRLFVPTTHPFAKRKKIRIRDLQGQRMVFREKGSTTRLAFERALEQAGVTVATVMEIGSREAVWLAVARGIGISVVSDIEFIPHPELCMVDISDAEIFTTAHVNCLRERKDSRLVKAFFEIVDELRSSH